MSKGRPSSLPYRQATRLLNEFQVGVVGHGVRVVGHNVDRLGALWMIYRAALRSEPGAVVSNVAIANSLSRPVETMRRQVQALVRLGLLVADKSRFRIAADFLDRPDIITAGDHFVTSFTAMVDAFDRAGFDTPAHFAALPKRRRLIAALDVDLAAFELSESRLPSMNMYLSGVVSVINASRITYDPVLADRYGYAHTVPPRELRKPATVTNIASMHGFPYATIWRHVDEMTRQQIICAAEGGYLLHNRWIDNDETSALSRERIDHVIRVLQRAAREEVA